jgi:hypothetical protein
VKHFVILIAVIFASLPSLSFAQDDLSVVLRTLEKHKMSLPKEIRGGLFLTDIIVEQSERSIRRIYDHAYIDFGRLTAREARGVSSRLMGEALEQCDLHKGLIYDQGLSFKYYIRDRAGRLMVLASVDENQCDAFNAYHHHM